MIGQAAIVGLVSAFTLTQTNDTLYYLNEWRLPYPVYQFQTGDVDGDGQEDAMVGVVKKTRFHREIGRRLFIFKQVNGKVRPLWLGSQLGAGELQDFRFVDGRVRSLETAADYYIVAEYRWEGFGLGFERFLYRGTEQEIALQHFSL